MGKAVALVVTGALLGGGYGLHHEGILLTPSEARARNIPAANLIQLGGIADLRKTSGTTPPPTTETTTTPTTQSGLLKDPPIVSPKRLADLATAAAEFRSFPLATLCDPHPPAQLVISSKTGVELCAIPSTAQAVIDNLGQVAVKMNLTLSSIYGSASFDMDATYGTKTVACVDERVDMEQYLDNWLATGQGGQAPSKSISDVSVVVDFSNIKGHTTPCDTPNFDDLLTKL